MNMEVIQNAASGVLLNVSLAVITFLGAYAVYYIRLGAEKVKVQTAQITDEAGRKLLENALNDVAGLAELTVGAMEQTTAKALREAVKNGTAKKTELEALGKQVYTEVRAAIGPEAQNLITRNLGNFDAYLTKCIEDAVLRVKQKEQKEPYARLSKAPDFEDLDLLFEEPEDSKNPVYQRTP